MSSPRVLCLVCARGGSKGLPRKNVRNVGGEPLIAYSIADGLDWERSDRVVVSTDDDEIATVAREHGAEVPFTRPDELASDEAAKLPVLRHAVETLAERGDEFDYVVDLQPTAPLRTTEDIEQCFTKVAETNATNAYTVTEPDANPYFNVVELNRDGHPELSKSAEEFDRRQDAPDVYQINGSVYVYETEFLLETDTLHSDSTRVSVMPPERSVDIDRPLELEIVDALLERAIK